MKKKVVLIICMLLILFCSCSIETPDDKKIITTTSVSVNNTDTEVTTTNIESLSAITSNETSTISESTIEYDKIDKIIEYTRQNFFYDVCFYDFDKDGSPELVDAVYGIDDYTYDIYTLSGDEPKYIGTLLADSDSTLINRLTLYKDTSTNSYFYFGQTRTIYFGIKKSNESYLYKYIINGDKFEMTCVGKYKSDWNGEKNWYKDIEFMGAKMEDGYYDFNQFKSVLGVDKYLSQFEKIEEVNFNLLGNDSEYDFEKEVREELGKYPDFNKQ